MDETIRRSARTSSSSTVPETRPRGSCGTERSSRPSRFPGDFLAGDLRGMLRSPRLEVQTSTGTIGSRVNQQIQALVYSLNRQLQQAFIRTQPRYVDALKHGATITSSAAISETSASTARLGPSRAAAEPGAGPRARLRPRCPARARPDRCGDAGDRQPDRARRRLGARPTWALSAQVQSYALAVTIAFLDAPARGERARLGAGRERRREACPGPGRASASWSG